MRYRGHAILTWLLFTTGVPPQASAGTLPTFRLERCAWSATNIVVVTEGQKMDRIVEAIESWKGDIKKGEILKVPALAAFASKTSRSIPRSLPWVQEHLKEPGKIPTHVSCSLMILFLVRHEKKEGGATRIYWEPAAPAWGRLNEMHVSVAWIEEKKVYANSQLQNPGPSEITYQDATEEIFKKDVLRIVGLQEELKKAVDLKDSARLERAMTAIMHYRPTGPRTQSR